MIKIIADSTCNLSDEIIEKYDISIVPLFITIKDKTYIDGEEITPDEMYSQLASLEKLPTTGAPSPEKVLESYEEFVEKGYKEIIFIAMSSGTSAVYQSAEIAKTLYYEKHKNSDTKIYVVDSLSMSHGSGYLIMKSAMMRDNGASYEEIIEFNEKYKKRVKHYLSVDDLDNLLKSGRLSNVSAQIGKILHIKPIMTMKKGKGAIEEKARGRKKVLSYYINQLEKRIDKEMTDFIIIGYTSDILFAENLKRLVEQSTEFDGDIYIMQMGCAVGTHVGLGGVAMYFIEKPKVHSSIYASMKAGVKEKTAKLLNKNK